MTPWQRRVLIGAAALTALALLFPPVHTRYGAGFAFVFDPGGRETRFDGLMLLAEIAGIALLAGLGWLLARPK